MKVLPYMLLKGYYFLTEQEAERRLAELKGEKK